MIKLEQMSQITVNNYIEFSIGAFKIKKMIVNYTIIVHGQWTTREKITNVQLT